MVKVGFATIWRFRLNPEILVRWNVGDLQVDMCGIGAILMKLPTFLILSPGLGAGCCIGIPPGAAPIGFPNGRTPGGPPPPMKKLGGGRFVANGGRIPGGGIPVIGGMPRGGPTAAKMCSIEEIKNAK